MRFHGRRELIVDEMSVHSRQSECYAEIDGNGVQGCDAKYIDVLKAAETAMVFYEK
jgi:hypothetical protein